MIRDLDQKMYDLDGKEFTDKATLKIVCFGALSTMIQGDETMTVANRMVQYSLLQKINKGGEADLTSDEIVMIKDRAAKLYPVIALGALVKALEKDSDSPK